MLQPMLCRRLFYIGLSILVLNIGGCGVTPATLGISQENWANYSDQQRRDMIANYKAISVTKQEQEKDVGASSSKAVQVYLQGGEVMLPPFVTKQKYMPAKFRVLQEECKDIDIYGLHNKQKTALKACYLKGVLYLDPSRYDPLKQPGSIRFYYVPLWQEGLSYHHITSSGYVQLTDVNVHIKMLDDKPFSTRNLN